MAIDQVKIRAEIKIGNSLTCETPYIGSFNVTRSRGQFSTFSAQMKVNHSSVSGNITGDNVVIKAGEGSASDTIFTGIVKKATISPCFDDPAYVMLNIQGTDILSYLAGKKYTRRCRGTESTWVSIQGVTRPGFKSSKFSYQPQDKFFISDNKISGGQVTQHRIENNAGIISNNPNPGVLEISHEDATT